MHSRQRKSLRIFYQENKIFVQATATLNFKDYKKETAFVI
jgi:hypothetical protein